MPPPSYQPVRGAACGAEVAGTRTRSVLMVMVMCVTVIVRWQDNGPAVSPPVPLPALHREGRRGGWERCKGEMWEFCRGVQATMGKGTIYRCPGQ